MTDRLRIASLPSTSWGTSVKDGSSHNEQIHRFLLSTSLPREKEEVEQQQCMGQLCGRQQDNHPEMKGAATKAGVCLAVFLGEVLLIDKGTDDSEPPQRNVLLFT